MFLLHPVKRLANCGFLRLATSLVNIFELIAYMNVSCHTEISRVDNLVSRWVVENGLCVNTTT